MDHAAGSSCSMAVANTNRLIRHLKRSCFYTPGYLDNRPGEGIGLIDNNPTMQQVVLAYRVPVNTYELVSNMDQIYYISNMKFILSAYKLHA